MFASATEIQDIFELRCLNGLEDVGPLAMFAGILAIPLCIIMPIPQYYKLYKIGNAAGYSSLMLFIGNIGRMLNLINLVILHYNQMKLCFAGGNMFVRCQPSLLIVYSGVTGFLSMMPLYFVVARMNSRRLPNLTEGISQRPFVRFWFGTLAQVAVIAATASPLALLAQERRCEPLQSYASLIGLVNGIFLCLQYVPQIVLTLVQQESGSVSYMMYIPDIIGGYIMTCVKAFGTHERISTWLPYALMHTLELLMVALNALHDPAVREQLNAILLRIGEHEMVKSRGDRELAELDAVITKSSFSSIRSRSGTRSPTSELLHNEDHRPFMGGESMTNRSTFQSANSD